MFRVIYVQWNEVKDFGDTFDTLEEAEIIVNYLERTSGARRIWIEPVSE